MASSVASSASEGSSEPISSRGGIIKGPAAGHDLRSCFLDATPSLGAFDADWFLNLCTAARDDADVHRILRMVNEGLGCMACGLVQVGPTRQINLSELLVDVPDALVADLKARRVCDDAVMVASEQHAVGFSWSNLDKMIHMTERRRETIGIYLSHGVSAGFTVPFCVPNEPRGFASFGFVDPKVMSSDVTTLLTMIAPVLFETSRRVRGLWFERRQPIGLTPRQVDCLTGVARGLTDAQVAHELGISVHGVYDHIEAARSRYGARKRPDLVIKAIRAGDLHWDRITGEHWAEVSVR